MLAKRILYIAYRYKGLYQVQPVVQPNRITARRYRDL
jgi:hypothetical protein